MRTIRSFFVETIGRGSGYTRVNRSCSYARSHRELQPNVVELLFEALVVTVRVLRLGDVRELLLDAVDVLGIAIAYRRASITAGGGPVVDLRKEH